MVLEGLGHLLERFQAAAPGLAEPGFEEPHGARRIGLEPEAAEALLGQPSPGGFQIALRQRFEALGVFGREIFLAVATDNACL